MEAEVRAQVVAQLGPHLRRHFAAPAGSISGRSPSPRRSSANSGGSSSSAFEPLHALVDEQAAERVAERRPCGVVRQAGGPGAPAGFRRRRPVDLDGDVVEFDRDRRPGQLLPVGDGTAQDVQHRQPALRAGDLVRSTAVATTPCASRPGVVNTTADSPSAGSTPPTYRMNAALGPTTSTPLRASRSRWV